MALYQPQMSFIFELVEGITMRDELERSAEEAVVVYFKVGWKAKENSGKVVCVCSKIFTA